MRIFRKLKALFSKGNYEIKREVQRLLDTDSPVIIEAGAHIGSDTVEMSKIWPKGHIHAFEPIPAIYTELVATTHQYSNITTYKLALSDKSGDTEIFVSSGKSNGSSSLLPPKDHIQQHPDVKFEEKILISAVTLDSWAKKYSINNVDFAWFDMQGLEAPVLQASGAIFDTIKVVYAEVNLKEMYEGVTLYPDFKKWMSEKGFCVKLEEMPYPDFGNVLFVKE